MHVALAQERTLRGSSHGVSLCFWCAIDVLGCAILWCIPPGMQRTQRHQHASTLCQRSLHAVVGACPFIFFLCIRKKEKQDDSSLPHCVCAQSLTAHVVGKNCDYACAVVRQHACNHLSAGMDAVKDHKANTSLTEVYLSNNNVGDAGAAALADALQATVLACGSNSFQACASCFRRCRFATWFQQLASPSY